MEAVLQRIPPELTITGHRAYNISNLQTQFDWTYRVAHIRCIEQGNGEAQEAARDLIEELAPRWIVVVGIGGGVPSHEFTLGDVIVSTRIKDFRVEAAKEGGEREYATAGGIRRRVLERAK